MFRVVMEVTTDDVGALGELFAEVVPSLEEHLPGTLAWETFVDEASGRVLVYEVHQDEEAADVYEAFMTSEGFAERAYALLTSGRVWILNPVVGPTWSGIADESTSQVLAPAVGFSR